MENRRPHGAGRLVALTLVASALHGCACAPWQAPARDAAARPGAAHAALPRPLSIGQARHGQGMRYVFCSEADCAPASEKSPADAGQRTLVRAMADTTTTRAPLAPLTRQIEIDFAFNVVRLAAADRERLRAAAQAAGPSRITITGRSDAAGTTAARQRSAVTRAEQIRRALRSAGTSGDIRIAYAIAARNAPTAPGRAAQRRATVRFEALSTSP